jgi:hypothetical protein
LQLPAERTEEAITANNAEPRGRAELPMFQSGGFVTEAGLVAVIHDGKYFNPTPGSAAADRAEAQPEQAI